MAREQSAADQLGQAIAAALAPALAARSPEPSKTPEPVTEPAAYDVTTFCKAHSISRPTFFKLRQADAELAARLGRDLLPGERRAPRCKDVGHKILISREAAAEWRNAP